MEKAFTSKYLRKEISLETSEIGTPAHQAVENYILNELDTDLNVRYDFNIVHGCDHPVAICTMQDAKGRRVQGIGEVSEETANSQLAKQYPVTLACNRAFDRAAMLYLGITEKIQTPVKGNEKPAKEEPKPEKAKPTEAPKREYKKKETTAPAPAPAPEATPAMEAANETPQKPEEKPSAPENEVPVKETHVVAEKPAESATATSAEPAPWDQAYEFGKYRGTGKTFRQVAEEDPGYVDWMVANSKSKKIVEVFSAYRASLGSEA